jgi:hypothetical protein
MLGDNGSTMIMMSDDTDYAYNDDGDDNVDAVGMEGMGGTPA